MSATRPLLVCVYLRGAADALNLVVPYADDRYYALRPTLAVARPDDPRAAAKDRAIDLDGRFGLHPSLAKLAPLYGAGELAVVHAVGSDDATRSHFEAQDRMEHAGPKDEPAAGGWIARHLDTRPGRRAAGLTAVAAGTSAPESLRGAPVAVLRSVDEYRLGKTEDAAFERALAALYASRPSDGAPPLDADLRTAGRDALATLGRLRRIPEPSARGAAYPEGPLGDGLREIARLSRADLGVEVACVDHDGWDTHFVEAQLLPDLARTLGDALFAFREDIGDAMDRVVVVCMTEFGRRAYENTSLGTDHGRGGIMFVLGGGVRGRRVITDWPGLAEDRLEPPGDLAVTIDFREILAEIVRARLGNPRVEEVFPKTRLRRWGLFG